MQDQLERVKNRALFIRIFIIENNYLLLVYFILEKKLRERERLCEHNDIKEYFYKTDLCL